MSSYRLVLQKAASVLQSLLAVKVVGALECGQIQKNHRANRRVKNNETGAGTLQPLSTEQLLLLFVDKIIIGKVGKKIIPQVFEISQFQCELRHKPCEKQTRHPFTHSDTCMEISQGGCRCCGFDCVSAEISTSADSNRTL